MGVVGKGSKNEKQQRRGGGGSSLRVGDHVSCQLGEGVSQQHTCTAAHGVGDGGEVVATLRGREGEAVRKTEEHRPASLTSRAMTTLPPASPDSRWVMWA